ncbi:MAG TPA: carboxypeptidase-like regulatory domain-containing protein, partial [Armatimonadota bacterium]|nr:carboxypeptidase-like regulatory domain-containing protein [Armatimonadota bacterium]
IESYISGSYIAHVPLRARIMSLSWLGVGTLNNIPLPELEEDARWHLPKTAKLTLPAWLPGISVSGRIFNADGTPWVHGRLCCSLGNHRRNDTLTVQTDDNGEFLVPGVPVGNLFLYAESTNNTQDAWTLEVPAIVSIGMASTRHLPGFTLRMSGSENYSANASSLKATLPWWNSLQQLWWIPDGGVAHALPVDNQWLLCSDYRYAGPGWLWSIDNDKGNAQCLMTRLMPGRDTVDYTQCPSDGGPLGVLVIGDFCQGLPGTVTLLGRNALASIRADFPRPQWQPLPALGAVAMQIDSVPPGDYTVIVNTPNGTVQRSLTVTEAGGNVQLTMLPPSGK